MERVKNRQEQKERGRERGKKKERQIKGDKE